MAVISRLYPTKSVTMVQTGDDNLVIRRCGGKLASRLRGFRERSNCLFCRRRRKKDEIVCMG